MRVIPAFVCLAGLCAAALAFALGVSPPVIASHLVVAGSCIWLARRNSFWREEPSSAVPELAAPSEALANELAAIRRRMDLMTTTASVQIWEYDLKRRAFNWYENRLPALGLQHVPLERFLQEFDRYANAEDWAHAWSLMTEAISAGLGGCTYQYRYVRDGKTIHVRDRIKIERDSQGRAIRVIGAGMDITAEVETRELLMRQSQHLMEVERRLERASLSSSEGHFEWSLATGDAWYSSSVHALLGFEPGTLPTGVEPSLRMLQREEDRQWQREAFESHIRNGTPYEFEAELRTATGELRWFRIKGEAERDADGRAVALAGSMHDIHQRRLIERELKDAQLRFERAIKGTQDGLWELAADGTAWISPRLIELLGYRTDELPAHTNFLRDFLHPDDAEAVQAATRAHYDEGQPYDIEIRLRTHRGEYRWYRARAAAERDSAGTLRLSGSLQDVSEAREAREQVLRAMESAEQANRAKSDFLAHMSHEIRTPMNGVIGMSALLADTQLDRTQRDYATTISSSAQSLLTVINDILDFSKIEAGKLDVEKLEYDPRANAENVASMMAFQAAEKRLELILDVKSDVPSRLYGDPQRVRQCLINLVGNAIKFTRSGEVVIELSTTTIEGEPSIQYEVRDTGIGIAPDSLAKLFQPFVQADSSTTRHFGGTGLGLSIVRRLAELMGGTAGAHSIAEVGSRFWFRLPLIAGTPIESPVNLSRLGRRILILEDNATQRRVIAGIARTAGYEAETAANAEQAMLMLESALADAVAFECVLIDLNIPSKDGEALATRLAADRRFANTRRVALVPVNRHENDRIDALDARAWVRTPIRAQELIESLDRAFEEAGSEVDAVRERAARNGHAPAVSVSGEYAARALLVDDNVVNQKVAVRFLERLGCTAQVASNGEECVQAYAGGTFDIVFMDLQMPVMDGFTATRHIRELEAATGKRTTIVALTADAMAGQLERCLAADMDGMLTKPLDMAHLRETLDQFNLRAATATLPSTSELRQPVMAPVDLNAFRTLTDGEADFARELIDAFTASGAGIVVEIGEALVAQDRNALAKAAHKLRGASANIHAVSLSELAQDLESSAASASGSRLKELTQQVSREYRRTQAFVADLRPDVVKRAAG